MTRLAISQIVRRSIVRRSIVRRSIVRRTVAALALTTTVLAAASTVQAESLLHANRHAVAAVAESRIEISLRNALPVPRLVRVGASLYTVPAKHTITFLMPRGTAIVAYSPERSHPSGSTIAVVEQKDNHATLDVD
jgi:hypothetical protein